MALGSKPVPVPEFESQATALRRGGSISAKATPGSAVLSATGSPDDWQLGAPAPKLKLLGHVDLLATLLSASADVIGEAAHITEFPALQWTPPFRARAGASLSVSGLPGTTCLRLSKGQATAATPSMPAIAVSSKPAPLQGLSSQWGISTSMLSAKFTLPPTPSVEAAHGAAWARGVGLPVTPRLESVGAIIKFSRPCASKISAISNRAAAGAPAVPQNKSETVVEALGLVNRARVPGTATTGGARRWVLRWDSTKLDVKSAAAGLTLKAAARGSLGPELFGGLSGEVKVPASADASEAAPRAPQGVLPAALPLDRLKAPQVAGVALKAMWLHRLPLAARTLLGGAPAQKSPAATVRGGRGGKALSRAKAASDGKGAIECSCVLSGSKASVVAQLTGALLAPPVAVAMGLQASTKLAWPGEDVRSASARAPGRRGKKAPLALRPGSGGLPPAAAAASLAPSPTGRALLPQLRHPAALAGWAAARCDLWRGHSLSFLLQSSTATLGVVYRGEWKDAVRPWAGRPKSRGIEGSVRATACTAHVSPTHRPGTDAVGLTHTARAALRAADAIAVPGHAARGGAERSDGSLHAARSDFNVAVSAGGEASLLTGKLERVALAVTLDSTAR